MSQISQESPEPTKVPPGNAPTAKEDPKSTDSTKSELQELKAAVEALKTDIKARSGISPLSEQEETGGAAEEVKKDASETVPTQVFKVIK